MRTRALIVTAILVCGGLAPQADAVVGGQPASPGEYPWMAALYSGSSPSSGQFCGGSLVRPTLVVTAAHCVESLLGGLPIVGSLLQSRPNVLLGRNTLNGTGGEQIPVSTVRIHPDYAGGSSDIAVLQLSRASVQAPIDWARRGQEPFFAAGVMSTVTGWGTTSEGGSGSNELREAEVPIVSDAKCRQAYPGLDAPLELCAGFDAGGVDTCQGDSGGPLMVVGPAGRFILAGLTSYGNGCARPGFPGVYAEVAALSTFIEQNAG